MRQMVRFTCYAAVRCGSSCISPETKGQVLVLWYPFLLNCVCPFLPLATLQGIMANITPAFPWRQLKVQSENLHELTKGISVFTGEPSTCFQKEVQSRMRREREYYFTSFSSLPPFLLQLHEILSAIRPGLGLLDPENRQWFHFEFWVHKERRRLCETIFSKQRLRKSQK